MLKKMVTAGSSLALVAGVTVALAAVSTAAQADTPTDPYTLAVGAADRAAASGLDGFTAGVNEQYQRTMVTPWVDGLYSVAYERTYKGIPVVGGDAVVLVDGQGRIRATSSASTASVDVATTPSVSLSKAESSAKDSLSKVDRVEDQRLVVYISDDTPRLAWETDVYGQKDDSPSHLSVFTDALNGKVLGKQERIQAGSGTGKWNGPAPLSIGTTGSGSSYSMRDPNNPGLSCAQYNGSVLTGTDDSWGNGNGTSIETGCVDAMWSAQQEAKMLREWLGRNGHNGNGGSWPIYVGLNDQNAYWDGSTVTIGKNTNGEWISSQDVVGHEFGHGLDQNTPGGTSSEAGLGEGTGDIFGALTEAYSNEPAPYDTPDFLVGEQINLVGTGPIRNMYNPSLVSNDPNCYSSAIPGTEVHAAAGPLNHWFYLMAQGSNPAGGPASPTCNNSTVTGMGIQNAGKVFYGGMLLKTSSMTYKKYRTATLTAAKNLDSTCGLFAKTKAAWDAISVPAQTADPTCTGGGGDFSMALNPASGTVNAGSSTTSTLSTTTTSGSAQTVNLTAAVTGGSGVTATLNPTSVTSGNSSTLSIAVAAGTASGTRTITVTGTGSVTHTVTYNLTIQGTPPANDFSISASPASGTISAGSSGTTTINTATTSGSAQSVSLSASAPSGISVSFNPASVTSGGSSTATISVAAGTAGGPYTITITGTGTSATHSTTYALTVPGSGCSVTVGNGGFESGTSPWTGSTGAIGDWSSYNEPAHSGTRSAYLGGYGYAATDTINQSITLPSGCTSATLTYWLHIDTAETGSTVYDKFTVSVNGTVKQTFSNVNAASGYVQRTVALGSYAGQTITLTFKGVEDASLQTSFLVDDVTIG